jgi:deazaflavin-dependent oxidoreductase (nitroreductase family)
LKGAGDARYPACPNEESGSMTDQRYLKPTTMDTLFNRAVGMLMKLGISVMGSRILAVKGRSSGQWRTTPVNVLTVDGGRYLVAPRGQAQWVRNIRAAGGGELRLGGKAEPFGATELADADKPPIIRAYLARWGWEVGRFFDGLTKDASDEDIAAVAPGFPIFRIDRPGE